MAGESIAKSWMIFRKGIRNSYDYVGMVMATSALWFFIAFLPLLAATTFSTYLKSPAVAGVAALLTLITFGPATAAVHAMIARILDKEEVLVREFFFYFKKYFTKSVLLVLLNALLLAILFSDFLFSINNPSTFFRLLSGIWIYFMIFWVMMSNYIFPFLVHQDIGVLRVMQRAALLALDNAVVTLLLTVMVVVVAVLNIVITAGVLLLMMGIIAFLQNGAFLELMKKYETDTGTTAGNTGEQADEEE